MLEKLFIDRATYGWGKRFPKFTKNGSALDIGCGNGKYLSFLKHHGWNVRGVEIGESGAKAAKELFDIDVHVGPLETAPFDEESFDYISMFHSLEHVYDPRETVANVYELLKRDGVFYVEVPNVDSFGARIDGEHWFHWDMPRHIWGFSNNSLRRLVECSGFRIVEMTTINEPSHEWAITYRNEEAIGNHLEKRPSVSGPEVLEAKRKNLMSKIAYTIDRMSGNYLCCWMTK
jgi:SAM-dependent methyltransferase